MQNTEMFYSGDKRFRPIDEAIITSGGVKVSEINPKTMESKLVKNLYFAARLLMWMHTRADLIFKLRGVRAGLPGVSVAEQ